MPQAKIVYVAEVFSTDRERLGKRDKLVTYQVADQPVRMVRLPAEQFNTEALTAAIQADQAELTAFRGKLLEF